MSGISGYGLPKRFTAQNQQSNDTSQPNRPANPETIQDSPKNSPENNTEANQLIVIESVTDQSNLGSDTQSNNQYKYSKKQSESSFISVLTGTSQSYEALYSSEDDDSLPKVIDEHDEKLKSCIVIRDSSINIQTDDSKADNTTKLNLESNKLRGKIENEMTHDEFEVTDQTQLNLSLKLNDPKEDDTKKNEDAKAKEALQSQSSKSTNDQKAQFSQVENNGQKTNRSTPLSAKHDETKNTGSFTTHYLLSAEKLDVARLKKLAQTLKVDNLNHRLKNVNDNKLDLRTNVNFQDASTKATNAATTNKIDLQRGENCPDLTADENSERKPIGISPGRLDILNDLHNTGEGTHYNLGDNVLEKSSFHIKGTDARKILTTESQIENLRKIKHILEDKLKFANNPDEKDEERYQDVASLSRPNNLVSKSFSVPHFDEDHYHKAEKIASDETDQTKPVDLLTEKPKERGTVVEVVKLLPDALVPGIEGITSTAFKLKDTQAPNLNQFVKQALSKKASITTRSEDASEVIQVILPEDNLKAALVDLPKAEPKDPCEPCPGMRPGRTTCIVPPKPPEEEPIKEEELPPPPLGRRPPPFQCFEPAETPEYEGSDTSQNSQTPPSRLRLWWHKLKERVLNVVLRMYNCFNCERFCPRLSPAARLQSPNTSSAYEKAPEKEIKITTTPETMEINSNAALIHSIPILDKSVESVHRKPKPVSPEDNEPQILSEGSEPEKSKSAGSAPEKTKSTRFVLENTKSADSGEAPQRPVSKSTIPSRK